MGILSRICTNQSSCPIPFVCCVGPFLDMLHKSGPCLSSWMPLGDQRQFANVLDVAGPLPRYGTRPLTPCCLTGCGGGGANFAAQRLSGGHVQRQTRAVCK